MLKQTYFIRVIKLDMEIVICKKVTADSVPSCEKFDIKCPFEALGS